MYNLSEAEVIELFFDLRNDIERLSLSQYFCELINFTVTENVDAEAVLRLMLNSLSFLCKPDKNLYIIKACFELRLMCLLGFTPNLIACNGCSVFEDENMYLNLFDSSVYCSDCKRNTEGKYIKISAPCLSAMRHITFSEFSKMFSFSLGEKSAKELSSITEKYLLSTLDKDFNSLKYFNSIRI